MGAGSIDAALNNYVAIHYSSKHMSWLHCFWGVGTIISPFVMSYSLTYLSWNDGYRIISFIQFGITIILLLTLPVWKVNEKNKVKDEPQIQPKYVGIFEALKIKGVPNLLLGFFCYCAAEGTAMAWSCTYLVEAKSIDEPTAAAFASCAVRGKGIAYKAARCAWIERTGRCGFRFGRGRITGVSGGFYAAESGGIFGYGSAAGSTYFENFQGKYTD